MKRKIVIEIDNLTEAQVIALCDIFALWEHLGNIGSSRWTAFYADGDGNFQPKITVDGKKPERTTLFDTKKCWKNTEMGEVYFLDFDSIAWRLHDN